LLAQVLKYKEKHQLNININGENCEANTKMICIFVAAYPGLSVFATLIMANV